MKIKTWLQKTLITGATFLLIALFIFPPEKLQAIQDQVAYRMTSSDLQEKFYRTNIAHEINLDITDHEVEEALREVANQTGLKLTYRWDKGFEKKVTLKEDKITVSEALDFILDGTGLNYLVSSDGYLLINQAEEVVEEVAIQETISGEVTDAETGEALPGVNILVQGTSTGTTTDLDGNFELAVPDLQQTLVISYIGYLTQVIAVDGQTDIEIALAQDVAGLEEVVVVGYSTLARSDLTGSVAVINTESISKNTDQVENMLQGQGAGVTVQTSGQPGEQPTVRIRGLNTFGNNAPLYVVDGVPTQDVRDLNPNDVESIQVLKDASAASIYGARAANGVIIIETATSRGPDLRITYDYSLDLAVPDQGNVWNIADPYEQMEITWQAMINDGLTPSHPQYGSGSEPVMPDFILPAGGMHGDPGTTMDDYYLIPEYNDPNMLGTFNQIIPANHSGTNWWGEMFDPVVASRHNLSFQGGGDLGNYLVSLNYTDQPGVMMGTYLKRYSARVNSELQAASNIRIGQNISFTLTENPTQSGGPQNNARETPSIIPVHDLGGNFAGGAAPGFGRGNNPIANIHRDRHNIPQRNRLFGNIYSEVDMFDNRVLFRTRIGGEYYVSQSTSFNFPQYETAENNTSNSYSETVNSRFNYTWTNTLQYTEDFNQHRVQLLLGSEINQSRFHNVGGSNQFYYTFDPNYVNLSTGSGTPNTFSNVSEQSLVSGFSRVDYNYDSRYLASATIRRDGSSKFTPEHQWGWFPAGSIGWRITQESFFPEISWLNELQLRGGYGIMGNELNIGPESVHTLYTSQRNMSYYDIDGTNNSLELGFMRDLYGNPQATWEKNITSNMGINATFLEGKIDLTFDYYNKKVKDLLYSPDLPGTAGTADAPVVNIATMQNTGFDITVGSNFNLGEVGANASLNITTYDNEIVSIAEGVTHFDQSSGRFGSGMVRNQVGESVSSFFGYDVIGFWNSQDEIDEANATAPSGHYQEGAKPGRFRFADHTGSGEITPADRVVLGNPNPDFTGGLNLGFNYRSFDVNAFFYGSYGNDIFQYYRWWTDFASGFVGANSKTTLYDSWTPDNPDAKVSIIEEELSISNNAVPNSYFVDDGSYVRLKNLRIGYTLPVSLTDQIGLTSVRLYSQLDNLFTITKYSGPDPEIGSFGGGDTSFGIDGGSYPHPRSFQLGVNIVF